MAWSSIGTAGASQSKTAAASITHVLTAPASAGQVVVVVVAKDNVQATDGNTNEVTSVSDSVGGNVWTKAREFCNGQGGAASGAVVSVWFSRLTNGIPAGGTITANFSSSVTAKAISVWRFAIDATSTVQIGNGKDLANDGSDPGYIEISSGATGEQLYIRGIASETNDTTELTPTSRFTAISGANTSGGGAASNMGVRGEFRIAVGLVGSNPTYVAADHASVFVALNEIPGGTTHGLSGTTEGSSSGSGGATGTRGLSGSSVGSSAHLGALNVERAIRGTSVAYGEAGAALARLLAAGGSASGESSAAGLLDRIRVFSGASAAVSEASGVLRGRWALGASSGGSSSATGAIDRLMTFAGSTAGESTCSALLGRLTPISGTATGDSVAAGGLDRIMPLEGSSAADSQASGAIIRSAGVSGTTIGASEVTAALQACRTISASTSGLSSAEGVVAGIRTFEGSTLGYALIGGNARLYRAVEGASAGSSWASGNLTAEGGAPVVHELSGAASGSSSLSIYWVRSTRGRTVRVM